MLLRNYRNACIVSIGDNKTRKKIAKRITAEFGIAVHPSAIVSAHLSLSEGTVVMQNAIIRLLCLIGKHCIISTAVSADHDYRLGSYVHVSPNLTLTGNFTV